MTYVYIVEKIMKKSYSIIKSVEYDINWIISYQIKWIMITKKKCTVTMMMNTEFIVNFLIN